jgi:hypothetical protein
MSVELPAVVHRDLLSYAEAHAAETGQHAVEPGKLIAPMLQPSSAAEMGHSRVACHQARRRERASSRIKATNRPTNASSF